MVVLATPISDKIHGRGITRIIDVGNCIFENNWIIYLEITAIMHNPNFQISSAEAEVEL